VTPRWWAAGFAGALLVVLAVVLLARIPWTNPATPPRADQIAVLNDLPADAVARGKALHAATRPSTYGSLVVGLLAALGLGLTPLGARIVELGGRALGGHWLAQAVLGGLAVILVGELLTVPFAAWRHRVLREYGLSTQDWGAWAVDLIKAYVVGAVIGGVALAGFFTLTRLFPRWWWASGAVAAAGLVVLLTFVFPVLVEPLFNRFTPMQPGALRSELMALAARDGLPVSDVLVADASRRTRALNAYVSGIGPTRRIVVYDTLLRSASPAEVESVVAHELGHAKHRDVVTATIIGATGAAVVVCALYVLEGWPGLLRRAGVAALTEPRAVGLLLAIAVVVGILAGPAQAYVSRRIEARADAHALAITGDPGTFEAMMSRLARTNLADVDPHPVEYALFASHPSPVQRIAMARAWART